MFAMVAAGNTDAQTVVTRCLSSTVRDANSPLVPPEMMFLTPLALRKVREAARASSSTSCSSPLNGVGTAKTGPDSSAGTTPRGTIEDVDGGNLDAVLLLRTELRVGEEVLLLTVLDVGALVRLLLNLLGVGAPQSASPDFESSQPSFDVPAA